MRLAEQLQNMVMLDTNEVFEKMIDMCEGLMRIKAREGHKRSILVEIKELNQVVENILVDGLSVVNLERNKAINSSLIATMFDNWLRNEGFTNYEWTKNMFKVYW